MTAKSLVWYNRDVMESNKAIGRVARRHGIELAVLFGSRAAGTHRPDSDADVAISGAPAADDFEVGGALSEALGANVDLVRLERAGPLLRFHALFYGRLLWGSPRTFARLRLRALKEWQDSRKLDAALETALDRRQ